MKKGETKKEPTGIREELDKLDKLHKEGKMSTQEYALKAGELILKRLESSQKEIDKMPGVMSSLQQASPMTSFDMSSFSMGFPPGAMDGSATPMEAPPPSQDVLTCQRCQTVNDLGSKFCSECGSELKKKNKARARRKVEKRVDPDGEEPPIPSGGR